MSDEHVQPATPEWEATLGGVCVIVPAGYETMRLERWENGEFVSAITFPLHLCAPIAYKVRELGAAAYGMTRP